jgi:hypothetical protein
MKRWTENTLGNMSDMEFALAILKEKRETLGNVVETPLSKKLDSSILMITDC